VRILLINGSPRARSNSEDILLYASEAINCRTKLINLAEIGVNSCKCCDNCPGERCVIDDEASRVWDEIADPDTIGVLFASPVHFGLPSELLLRFLNRGRFIRHRDFAASDTVFGVIACAGRRNGGMESTIISTWLPLVRQGMLPVGNGDKSSQYGAMLWCNKRGTALSDEWGCTQAEDLARNVERVGTLMYYGRRECPVEFPKMEFSKTSGTASEPSFMEAL